MVANCRVCRFNKKLEQENVCKIEVAFVSDSWEEKPRWCPLANEQFKRDLEGIDFWESIGYLERDKRLLIYERLKKSLQDLQPIQYQYAVKQIAEVLGI